MTCGIVLLLAFVSLAAFEIISTRRATIDELSALAKIVGHNVAGALAFNDANYAEGMLSALSAKQPIEYADIHAQDGRVFATYNPTGVEGGGYWNIMVRQLPAGIAGPLALLCWRAFGFSSSAVT